MKYTLILVALFLVGLLQAQEKTRILIKQTGFAKNHGLVVQIGAEVLTTAPKGELLVDTQVELSRPSPALIQSPNGDYGIFWVEPGKGEVLITREGFPNRILVKNAESNRIFQALQNAENDEALIATFEANSSHITALFFLNISFKMKEIPTETLQAMYELASDEDKKSLSDLEAYLATADIPKVDIDSPIHHFSGKNQEGKSIATDEFTDKYLLLDFSATWCGPCWEGYPELIKTARKLDKLQIITIMEDDNIKLWDQKVAHNKLDINWPVLWQIENKKELHEIYKVKEWPTFLMVNPDGKVIDRWSGLSSWPVDKRIKALLKKK